MNVFQTGLELLVVGMCTVFAVLLLLMGIIMVLSRFAVKEKEEEAIPPSNETVAAMIGALMAESDDELAAVMAVIAQKVPDAQNYSVTIRS